MVLGLVREEQNTFKYNVMFICRFKYNYSVLYKRKLISVCQTDAVLNAAQLI